MPKDSPKIIDVHMAEYKVAGNPTVLRTSGVGSCIVIVLHDPFRHVGGLAHTMLPHDETEPGEGIEKQGKYMDTAIAVMVKELKALGACVSHLKAKIIGGSHMFSALDKDDVSVGKQNADAAIKLLEDAGIEIVSTLTGGNAGRKVEFNIATGNVFVTTRI